MAQNYTARELRRLSFYETITAAVNDVATHGFDSIDRIEKWTRLIKEAASRERISDEVLTDQLTKHLGGEYKKFVEKDRILSYHPGVSAFRLVQLRPKLHGELDRRLAAARGLIKLNRDQAMEQAIRRFSGWATSIPVGGSKVVDKNDTKGNVRKSLAQLPFEERRVIIDQGHKFVASLNDIIANDCDALAAIWHSNWRQRNYNYRVDHKERDLKCYAVRNNWAIQKGFMAKGFEYTDDITMPGEEVYCRCHYQYIYDINELPEEMLTKKGIEALKAANEEIDRRFG